MLPPAERDPHAPRVEKIEYEGRTAFLKHIEDAPAQWKYNLLNCVAALAGLRLARAVPKPGGATSLAIERARIAELRGKGARVPEVIAFDDDWTLLSSLGSDLRGCLRRATPARQSDLVERVFEEVSRLHAAGGYLSQAFTRNVIVTPEGEIGFIDFEENPATVFSLEECQARDVLLLLTGIARYMPARSDAFTHLLASARPGVRDVLLDDTPKLASIVGPLAALTRQRELRSLQAGCQLLKATLSGSPAIVRA